MPLLKTVSDFLSSLAGRTRKLAVPLPLSRQHTQLLERVDQIDSERNSLIRESEACLERARTMRPKLKTICAEADREAAMMRKCFQESNDAWNDGDGATAKLLSDKGKAHKRRCEEMNETVN